MFGRPLPDRVRRPRICWRGGRVLLLGHAVNQPHFHLALVCQKLGITRSSSCMTLTALRGRLSSGKIKRIEEILKANGRKRSDVHLAVSPYAKPNKTDDLKRYRDAGADEVVLVTLQMPASVQDF